MEKIIKTFTELAKLDSPSGSETLVSTYIESWFKNHRLSYKKDTFGNIISTHYKKSVPFLICAHMDTVSTGVPIIPIYKNHWLTGNGTSILGADNKATITAIFDAWERYTTSISHPRAIQFLFTVKEETGDGLIHLPPQWIATKKGLVFDCAKPLGGIICNSPWIINFHIHVIGKSAHSSIPEKGINAIPPMLAIVSKIPVGRISKHTLINIGKINGGKNINTIPDSVSISGEIRSFHKKEFIETIKTIKMLTKTQTFPKTKIHWSQDGYCPGYSHDVNDPLIHSLEKIFIHQNKRCRFLTTESSVSDANILNDWGIKTINCTDGVVNAHTIKEKIHKKTLIKLSDIIFHCFHTW